MKLTYLLPTIALLASPAYAANFSVQQMTITGITPTFNAANGGGDTFPNDGKTYVHVKNGSGGSLTITFDAVSGFNDAAYGPITFTDTAVAIPAGEERIVGPFPPARFNNTSGRVAMTYSGVTSLTVGVFRTGKTY